MHDPNHARVLAEAFRARRVELGLSQREVAEATDGVVSHGALSRIESGARARRGQTFATVAALTSVLRLRIVIDPASVTVEAIGEEKGAA